MSDRAGQQIGHYRLMHLLGHGGFADVYLGEHIHLGTQAAIKLLDTRLSSEEVAQFKREARTIASLEHPHIVRVLDFGVEEQTPFLVMSYAAQGSLRQRYKEGKNLTCETIIIYVKQIAEALQHAHDAHVIHRDIKPENILLDQHNEILLSDFGLAVVAQSSSQHQTQNISGTIAYMAPEQAKGRPLPASDQYALGIVVYECLSGERPFQGTFEEVAVQHALAQPPALHERMPGISPALAAVVMRALAKDPQQRFASVRDFARMLEQAYYADKQCQTGSPTIQRCLPQQQRIDNQPENGQVTERIQAEKIYGVAWSPDKRRIAYGGHEHTVQVRGTTTGASTLLYHGHRGSVTMLAWSPTGQYIASASLDQTIQVWDAHSGQKIVGYEVHAGMVSALAWSPDGQSIASACSGSDHHVHIWDIANGHDRQIYQGHHSWIRALAWSPNGKLIASGSKNEVQVWEQNSGRRLITHRNHNSWVRAVIWSPDGTQIASAGEDNSVQVWEPANKGHLVTNYHGHTDWVNMLAWSPDGNWLASASRDNRLHIWRAETGNQSAVHSIRPASAYAITWFPDSKHIVSASGNGSVQVWQID